MIEIDWQSKAEKLWSLLDDIDTASDMFKPNDEQSYKAFYEFAMKRCQERGKYMNSLDGHTLTAVEQEEYDSQVQERFRLLNEWQDKVDQQVKSIIVHKTKYMSKDEEITYIFKWTHLVTQELSMWITINKPVTEEEIDDMCDVRGFDKAMRNYLEMGLEVACLRGKMALPIR